MDYIDDIVNDLDQTAIAEIMKYNIPTLDNYNDVVSVSIELGKKLNANLHVIKLSSRFLDIKLGEATEEKKVNEHITKALGFAKEFLSNYPLEEDVKQKVFACIMEHHGNKFSCIESEICSNADCYKFLAPKKILRMFYNWRQRGYNFEEIFILAEEKVDERWNALTLDICKRDLEENYKKIKEFLELAKKDPVSFVSFIEDVKKISDGE